MRLSVTLSAESVRQAAQAVERMAEGLPAKVDELCARLADVGMAAAVTAIEAADAVETGELASSVEVERRGDADYLVVTHCGYAVYVEFGTGVVGAGSAYPGTMPEGVSGPLSRTTKARQDGSWVYWDERQGRYRVTSGQRPVGFMALASAEMRSEAARVAREVFGA